MSKLSHAVAMGPTVSRRDFRRCSIHVVARPLQPHERIAIGFLLRHLAFGSVGGLVFGVALLALDLAGLRTLIFTAEQPLLWLFLMFFGLFVTFGSVGMGVGIMTIGHDRDGGQDDDYDGR